jgi:hypothetical protein
MPRRLPIARHAGKLLVLTAMLAVFAMADSAQAQGGGRLPFSDYQGPRGLSPYNALGFQGNNPTTGGTLGAVQNIIRPQQLQAAQLQQQQQQGRQLNRLQGQMRSMQRGSAQPETTIRATGHQATFMNMSHFYPR